MGWLVGGVLPANFWSQYGAALPSQFAGAVESINKIPVTFSQIDLTISPPSAKNAVNCNKTWADNLRFGGQRTSGLVFTVPTLQPPYNIIPGILGITGFNDGSTSKHRVSNYRSDHKGGANFLFVDGSTRFVTESTSLDVLRAASTIGGAETVDSP
jgi:prepilin-type processing-associated H-X9-DG protein